MISKTRIEWMAKRLGRMSLPEIAHRVQTKLYATAQQAGFGLKRNVPPPDLQSEAAFWIDPGEGLVAGEYQDRADRLRQEGLRFFGHFMSWPEFISGWCKDPKSGTMAPLSFGKTLDYRNPELVGDIKYLWEPNRHLYIVAFAQAHYLTGEEKYLYAVAEIIDSWLQHNPYMKGPNWTSSLELGIRLINWSIAWQLIGGQKAAIFQGEDGRKRLKRWLDAVYQHADFIRHHFSRFSSANNHLIGEAAGLFTAAVTWPYWKTCSHWRDIGQSILVREACKQNHPDGVNREQAIMYQQFVLDFLLVAGLAGKANQVHFPSSYWDRIERMLEFTAGCMDATGNMPMIGDADDGFVVDMSAEDDFCSFKSLLATGAVLFDRADFKALSSQLDHKTIWLMGRDAPRRYEVLGRVKSGRKVRRAFDSGGYYLLGKELGTDREVRCLVDCGELGYLSIAAHGHADALSIWLSVAGEEVLVDPGTFAYHTQPKWRNYFRGTSAHNTVRIDGQDQSVIGGNFMWIQQAVARCEVFTCDENQERFVGWHDGYRRLPDPVTHEREIVFEKDRMRFVVTDRIQCSGRHTVERHWHMSEKSTVETIGRSLGIVNKRSKVTITPLEEHTRIAVLRGDKDLPLGWVSRNYDIKVPAPTAVLIDEIAGSVVLQTIIQIQMEN